MSDTRRNKKHNRKKEDAANKKRSTTRVYNEPKKRLNKKKLLLFIGIPILLLLTTGIAYATHLYTTAQETAEGSFEDVNREAGASNLREEAVNPIDDNVSVLILGVDEGDERSEDGYFRTDTMMLATFNKEDDSVKLLTIPRDSYTYIPEVDHYTKINHAHSYGGADAAIETVENFLHVPVDYYARVNFNAFIDTVDALDGIEYDVPYDIEEMDENDKQGAIQLSEGYQNLNGKEALALARTRKYDSDIERGKRQQKILKTIADDATSASSVLKLDDLMQAVGNNLKTNLTFDHMKSFLSYGINNNFTIETVELDGEGGYLNDGLWYYVSDSQARMKASNELREQLDMDEARLSVFQDGTDEMIPAYPNSEYADQEPDVQQSEPDPYQTPNESEKNQGKTRTPDQHQDIQEPSDPDQPKRPSEPSNNQTQASPDSPTESNQNDANSSSGQNGQKHETTHEQNSKEKEAQPSNQQSDSESVKSDDSKDNTVDDNKEKENINP